MCLYYIILYTDPNTVIALIKHITSCERCRSSYLNRPAFMLWSYLINPLIIELALAWSKSNPSKFAFIKFMCDIIICVCVHSYLGTRHKCFPLALNVPHQTSQFGFYIVSFASAVPNCVCVCVCRLHAG